MKSSQSRFSFSTMNSVRELFKQSTNIYETFYPLNMVLKFFGLIPFTLRRRQSSKRPLMTLVDGFLLCFWASLYFFLFAINLMWGQQEPESEKSLLIKHGWHKLYLFQMLLLPCVIVLNFTNKLSIVECLRLMDKFDLVEVTYDYRMMFDLSFIVLSRNSNPETTMPNIDQQSSRSFSLTHFGES